MKKHVGKIIIAIVGLLVAGGVLAGSNFWAGQEITRQVQEKQVQQQAKKQPSGDTFSYQGEDSKDALTILREKTTVEQNASGLVVSINGRKADDAKKEFWAFYVNGKMAEVGPADYQTSADDRIAWKIEHY
jgi:hypothetical protein